MIGFTRTFDLLCGKSKDTLLAWRLVAMWTEVDVHAPFVTRTRFGRWVLTQNLLSRTEDTVLLGPSRFVGVRRYSLEGLVV